MSKILSDGISDGLALTYVKDGVMYPVGLTQEQVENLEIILTAALNKKINVFTDCPIANVAPLI